MELFSLDQMRGGWLVGDFEPNVIRSRDFEVAVKSYQAGDCEPSHHHKVAEEVTVIVTGKAKMRDTILEAGAIIRLEPGESTSFQALEHTITLVIKRPSVTNDKYLD